MEIKLDADYWNGRYNDNTSIWDLSTVSPPIKAYIDQLTKKDIAILIPGCGNAHEAAYLIENGFTNITVIDISEVPVKNMKAKFAQYLGNELKVIFGDFFDLNSTFDLIIEQTFFCAIEPSLRQKYADKMPTLLNENGTLAGLMFDFQFEKNPPFGGTSAEYFELFIPKFNSVKITPCYNSIESRNGREVFCICKI